MFDEIDLFENEEEQDDNDTVHGWRYDSHPVMPPRESIPFGQEDHYDEQLWQCPVCEVEVEETHEEWCSYQDDI